MALSATDFAFTTPAPKRYAARVGAPRGERHGNAKLTDAQVIGMRETFARWREADAGKPIPARRGYRELARTFGCSRWTARDIVTGRTRFESGGPIAGLA